MRGGTGKGTYSDQTWNVSYANQGISEIVSYLYFKFQVNTQLFHLVMMNLKALCNLIKYVTQYNLSTNIQKITEFY